MELSSERNLKQLLDQKAGFYNAKWFIADDPVSVPHRFSKKEDIEISGFLTATIAWGQRKMIVQKAMQLMNLMDHTPHDFLMNAGDKELWKFNTYLYRTYNGVDCLYFISSLREIYLHHGGLESIFTEGYQKHQHIYGALLEFRKVFMSYSPMPRTGKHLANVSKGSGAKRLNMFMRWMVRKNDEVDFGLWKKISPASLMIPLDIHVGRVARDLGLLKRRQNDWKAVEELTGTLRKFRPHDPVYYDYALFGMGRYEKSMNRPSDDKTTGGDL